MPILSTGIRLSFDIEIRLQLEAADMDWAL
jgi:hypothetical protein